METVRFTFMFSLGLAEVLENVLVTEEAWQTEMSKKNKKMHNKGTTFFDMLP
jgi:hypothetical protein